MINTKNWIMGIIVILLMAVIVLIILSLGCGSVVDVPLEEQDSPTSASVETSRNTRERDEGARRAAEFRPDHICTGFGMMGCFGCTDWKVKQGNAPRTLPGDTIGPYTYTNWSNWNGWDPMDVGRWD